MFGHASVEISVHDQLFRISQGLASVIEYAVKFHTLVVMSGWNEVALLTVFGQGPKNDLPLQMVIYDITVGLEKFILKAIKISQHLHACKNVSPLSSLLTSTLRPPSMPSGEYYPS